MRAGGLSLKGTGGLFTEIEACACVWSGVEVNRKMRITNYKRINKVKKTVYSVVRGHTCVGNDSLSQKKWEKAERKAGVEED